MENALSSIQQAVQEVLASGSAARRASREGGAPAHLATGWPAIDTCEGSLGLPWRGVHEAFGRHDGATLRLPAMSLALHLAWRVALQAPPHARVLWVGRSAWPHPRALLGALRGLRGGRRQRVDLRLWRASVFVDAAGAADRLWAVQMALQAPDAWLVVADGARLDLTATRRLQLAAVACPVLLLRPMSEARMPSAASLRWQVDSEGDAERARWCARLLRVRAGLPPQLADTSVRFTDWWERGAGLDAIGLEQVLVGMPVARAAAPLKEETHGTHPGDPAALVARGQGDSVAPKAGGIAA
ncbi:MAG: ImuA family protein [Planctomycetota bacterium]